MELHHHSLTGAAHGPRTRLARRVAARIKRFALDRKLAAGADPRGDDLLACRAEQLRSAPMRSRVAADIRNLVKLADRPPVLSAAAPIAPGVRVARSRLLILAARIETDPDVRPAGVAAIKLMLADAGSPIFVPSTVEELEDALDAVAEALG
jgi:hypothetical protein